MFCPRCGQQQATDSMRYCSRCGFAMEGTMHVLAHGGMLPVYQGPAGEKTISARRRGVKQGALLMLIGVLLVPILGIMSGFAPGRLDNVFAFFAAVSAVICFVGGPLRMLFASIFEEGAPPTQFNPQLNYKIPAPAMPPAPVPASPPPPIPNPPTQPPQRPQTPDPRPPRTPTHTPPPP